MVNARLTFMVNAALKIMVNAGLIGCHRRIDPGKSAA
jgi:hypothetical protein